MVSHSNTKKIRVGVAGCGSVSEKYFPHMANCPYIELVSACDIVPERVEGKADQFSIPHRYAHINEMLAGAPFDLFVNLTDMQEHERLNRMAIQAGKHVWSEKPIANSLEAGQELLSLSRQKSLRLWGATTVVQSPQFAYMAREIANGKIGKVAAAHASYGHLGPHWAEFFYTKGGGSLPDLGVYSLTYLTGLIGPAKSVTAMTSIVTPERNIDGKGDITVTEEDNAMVLMDHGNGVISHMQCGFNYFNAHDHADIKQNHHTITITGTKGTMSLTGYDWAPHAVEMATISKPEPALYADDAHDYVWQCGASIVAECLATRREPLFTPELALHVVEIMCAARASQETGRRISLKSTFDWPIIK